MKLNRKLVLVLALLVSVAMATTGTLAYLTDRDTKTNTFVMGNVDIELNEKFDQGSTLLPGTDVEKNPSIQNNGSTDAWVWMEVKTEPAEMQKNLEFTGESKKWTELKGKDGTYLYGMKLKPGEKTRELFTKVGLDKAIDVHPDGKVYLVKNGVAEDQGWTYTEKPTITVNAYAIQAEGFNTVKEAYEAYHAQWGNNGEAKPNGTVVKNADELKAALNNDGTIVLGADIDMSNWEAPSLAYKDFTLDGNGYSLKNQTNPLAKDVGQADVVIKNVNFENPNILGLKEDERFSAGVVAAEMNCEGAGTLTISNCTIKGGKIQAYKYAGGFVGNANGYNGTINITDSQLNGVEIETTDSSAGGLIGHTYNTLNATNVQINSCDISCAENRNGSDAKAGYAVGTVNGSTTTLKNVTALNSTLDNKNAKPPLNNGLVGRNVGGNVVTSTDDTATLTVNNATELAAAIEKGGTVVLGANIDAGENWTSVGMAGSLEDLVIDGNGHTITNLNKPLLKGNAAGNLTIKNLTIASSTIGTADFENDLGTGAFVCFMDSTTSVTFENCHLKNSSVTGSERAAGLIAYSSATNPVTIKDCSVENCTITAVGGTGGLVAYVLYGADISNTKVTGSTIESTEDRTDKTALAGSIIGTVDVNKVTLANVTSTGNNVKNKNVTPYSKEFGRVLNGATVEGN